MSYTHPLLSHAIDAHFDGQPPEGICTVNGALTAWAAPDPPTEDTLAQWVAAYEARPDTDARKNPRRAMEAAIEACRTIDDLKVLVKQLIR